jgi:hypothetical protein
MSSLKDSGAFVINIGNRQYPLDKILLSLGGYKISETNTMLSGRAGLGREKTGELFFEIKKIF